jgi:hypothetical protein
MPVTYVFAGMPFPVTKLPTAIPDTVDSVVIVVPAGFPVARVTFCKSKLAPPAATCNDSVFVTGYAGSTRYAAFRFVNWNRPPLKSIPNDPVPVETAVPVVDPITNRFVMAPEFKVPPFNSSRATPPLVLPPTTLI